MRFLTVADRELRSAARQKATYRIRWITAALFFVLQVWLVWLFNGFTNRRVGPQLFSTLAFLTFLYCLFIASTRTADSISSERREGTLGLLFLTNLSSAEIMAGKLCSSALASVYGLIAMVPMLALPLLMGGIPLEQFARTVLALLNGILFALSVGFCVSVFCKRQFTAMAAAFGAVLATSGGLVLAASAAAFYAPTKALVPWLACLSPFYALFTAKGGRYLVVNHFWFSPALVAGMSLVIFAFSTVMLARTWRDRPQSLRPGSFRNPQKLPGARVRLRQRLLRINPLYWLAGREQVSSPWFMAVAVLLTLVTAYVAAPFFAAKLPGGTAKPVLGHLFSWLWAGLAIHAMVLYYAALSASKPLAEEKQAGALELLLSTPLTERAISRGLWLAYARKMLFPVVLALLVYAYFLWVCMVMATLSPPGTATPPLTPARIFWAGLLDRPINGKFLDWEFGFMLRIAMIVLLLLILCWLTLGWVGRWFGVRLKHPGFAPITSLAVLIAPPVLLFSFLCYLAVELHLDRMPERLFLPILMWLGFAIGVAHCGVLSFWAATRLRRQLRPVALGGYQPIPSWRWKLPSRRALQRAAFAAGLFLLLTFCLLGGFYGYYAWRSQRAWNKFQAEMKQRGESLNLATLLPERALDASNFAKCAAFRAFVAPTNDDVVALLEQFKGFSPPPGSQLPPLLNWTIQTPAPLRPVSGAKLNSTRARQSREADARLLLARVEPDGALLSAVAREAECLPLFQPANARDAGAVLRDPPGEAIVLERLDLLFNVRACALVELGRPAPAGEDLLTGLRLAKLARQLPDTRATLRVQTLLMSAVQPLWEGLDRHAWSEPQLASFQQELDRFKLLADYTNAVQRLVLAHIEVWRTLPEGSTNPVAWRAVSDGNYLSGASSRLQPRGMWYGNCIRLHYAGQQLITGVSRSSGRVFPEPLEAMDWRRLPLDSPTIEVLQQSLWPNATPGSLAFAQTTLNQAILACALERFRIAKGAYPQSLDALVPAFLESVPQDAVSGRPMPYQFLGKDRFMLSSVGPNGTDDRNSKGPFDDWLWTYGTNSPAAPVNPPGSPAPSR